MGYSICASLVGRHCGERADGISHIGAPEGGHVRRVTVDAVVHAACEELVEPVSIEVAAFDVADFVAGIELEQAKKLLESRDAESRRSEKVLQKEEKKMSEELPKIVDSYFRKTKLKTEETAFHEKKDKNKKTNQGGSYLRKKKKYKNPKTRGDKKLNMGKRK